MSCPRILIALVAAATFTAGAAAGDVASAVPAVAPGVHAAPNRTDASYGKGLEDALQDAA